MFAAADVVLLNKVDVAPVFDFDLDFFLAACRWSIPMRRFRRLVQNRRGHR
jgi:Ni2+-binding GTPase involved in maturation of urease and hydrogenase